MVNDKQNKVFDFWRNKAFVKRGNNNAAFSASKENISRSSRDYESSAEATGGPDADADVSVNVSINSDVSLASDFSMESHSAVKGGKTKRPAERRESGRFHSAARILRSLTRNRNQPEEARKENFGTGVSSIGRSNPFYHSEGKGKKKKVERESGSNSTKERSRSFCDKPDLKKKFLRQQENNLIRQEARAKLDEIEKNQAAKTSSPSGHVRNFSLPSSSEASYLKTDDETLPKTSPLPESDSKTTLTPPEEDTETGVEPGVEATSLERDKERRSARKLTKDSGYETSPHSEGDYTNIELLQVDGEASSTKGNNGGAQVAELKSEDNFKLLERSSQIEEVVKCSSPVVSASSGSPRVDPSDSACQGAILRKSEEVVKASHISPADSLTNFADSLITSSPHSSPGASLAPAISSPSLYQYAHCSAPSQEILEEETDILIGALSASKSTPNLEEITNEDDKMVTNKLSSYYLQGSSSSKMGSNPNRSMEKKYWSPLSASEDSFNQTDYAHHLRSSSYQLLHSRQMPSGSCHARQLSNASNYSEGDEIGCQEDAVFSNGYHQSPHNVADRSRCFSFDNLGYEANGHSLSWNISEPDLSLAPPVSTSMCSLSPKYEKSQISPLNPNVPLLSKRSPNSCKVSSSPPPPPVRDASSLKYIRYGPGHEKFPSWPVPAGSSLVIPQNSQNHDSSISSGTGHPPCNYLSSQGSHRSHSWTEQSEYPKEKCGGYVRPSHKRQFSPSFQKQLLTVMEKCEKISPEVFKSRPPDDILQAPCYPFIDNYLHQTPYYPPFDREGRGIDDKDYSIPSPPERDPGMGDSHISEMTSAQLEEHTRRCDVVYSDIPYADFPQITPLLDQLRQESYTWDGSSERDSGRGESESVTDSRYSSNGRESVTTVVTNSSSASSSETLKWHGSLSDVSVLSNQSRETKGDQNIVHSARVQAPQRQNSDSVQYYSVNGRGKHFNKFCDGRTGREGNYPKPYREGKWSREVERNNEVNNLKKFPSYSYTQPLSQINEAPLAESRESLAVTPRSPKESLKNFSKAPTVAERISELERQSHFNSNVSAFNWPRTYSDFRDPIHFREEQYHSLGANLEIAHENDLKKTSEREARADSLPTRSDISHEYSPSHFQAPPSPAAFNHNHSRTSKRRDSEDSVLSSDSFCEGERSPFSTSYTYLDPEKRCKVSDATLKNIQKQALLSFYERRTGKCYNGASPSSSSSSSMASPLSGSDSVHADWAGRSFRKEKGSKSCTGMAKLGRVPTSEKVGGERNNEGERHCSKAIRRRSVNGRDARESYPVESSPVSDFYLQKPIKTISEAVNSCHNETDQETNDCTERKPSVSRPYEDATSNSSSISKNKIEGGCLPSTDAELPPLPPTLEDTPPKPPDRPPKKANLRSLFHPPATEENVVKEVPSPSRPYFYRKPPAPDPPLTPPESPPPSSTSSSTSRSSTPDLPPPPPPPVTEEVINDEPLPPPPLSEALQPDTLPLPSFVDESEEVVSSTPVSSPLRLPYKETTYHKDSYMAHRKDWKTGYEGRYRRTHSPTASDRNGTTVGPTDTSTISSENFNNISNHMKNSPSKIVTQNFHSSGNLRSAISTSSLLQRSTSPIDNVSFLTHKTNLTNNSNCNSYSNNINNLKKVKGWSPHVRQKSTTVNFTAEELRAFKARRAAQENLLSSTGELRSEMSSQDSSPSSSPLRPLTRAFSMGEPFHFVNSEEENCNAELCSAELKLDCNLSSQSIDSPNSHDGPITAHPAQVTEEISMESDKDIAVDALSTSSFVESCQVASLTNTSFNRRTSPTVLSDVSSSVTSSTSSLASTISSSSSSTLVSSSSSSSSTSSTTVSTSAPKSYYNRLDYKKVISTIGTCPSLTLPHVSEESLNRANIIVLTYGRTPKAEILNCDKLSKEFVQMGKWDSKLKALLAPVPPFKCMGSYMDGIFALEMRKDLLCTSHSQHPDFHSVISCNGSTQLFSNENEQTTIKNDGKTSHTTNSSGLSSGESKGTSLSSLPIAEVHPQNAFTDSTLHSKKEELIYSVNRKLAVLKGVQTTIEGEMSQNSVVGTRVTEWVVAKALPSEADKVKLHMEEIDKITSLLLSLCGRLARVENSLLIMKDEENTEQKRGLESKRVKLSDQLEEAKKLKEDIDRRAVQVCKILTKYLTEEEYAEYDHFVKMKVKLIMDKKETEDKIKTGEEQLMTLQNLTLSLSEGI